MGTLARFCPLRNVARECLSLFPSAGPSTAQMSTIFPCGNSFPLSPVPDGLKPFLQVPGRRINNQLLAGLVAPHRPRSASP